MDCGFVICNSSPWYLKEAFRENYTGRPCRIGARKSALYDDDSYGTQELDADLRGLGGCEAMMWLLAVAVNAMDRHGYVLRGSISPRDAVEETLQNCLHAPHARTSPSWPAHC